MAIVLSDNVQTNAPKPSDSRYLNNLVPYSSTTEATTCIAAGVRYSGLTVNVGGVEYWWKDGTGDGDLVLKTTGGGSATSGENVTKEITQASHGFAVKDFVGWSGGTYNKAIADGLYDGEFVGLVTEVPDASTFKVTQSGYVTGLTGLVTNTTYFLSESTAGLLTDTAPSGDTEISKAVLIANSTTTGWVLPYAGVVVSTGGTGGGTITGGVNGLGVSGSDICMGGTLLNDTVIDADNNAFSILNACCIVLDATGSSVTLTMSTAGTVFDDSTAKGICYAGDYSANITPNTLTNACWVTGCTVNLIQECGGTKVSGNTVCGITTYVSGDTICARSGLTFNDTTLTFNGTANRIDFDSNDSCITFINGQSKILNQDDTMCLDAAGGIEIYNVGTKKLNTNSTGIAVTSAGAIYTGTPSLSVSDTSNRGTFLLESCTDNPTDFFVKVNGNLTWAQSVRNSASDHNLVFYPSQNGTSWAAEALTLTTGRTVCANSCFKAPTVCATSTVESNIIIATDTINATNDVCASNFCASTKTITPALQVTTGAASGCVLTSDGSGNATWQTPSGGGIAWNGSTANGVGTYVDANTVCSQPNMTFDGSTLTVTSLICATTSMRTNLTCFKLACACGGDVMGIGAGETAGQLNTNMGTGERLWLGAESGIKIVSSPDNWGSAWAGRNEATLVDCDGDSFFPNRLVVCGDGAECYGASTAILKVETHSSAAGLVVYGDTGQTATNTAVIISNRGGTTNGGNYGLNVNASYNGTSSSGRSHGIISYAGGKTSRYNYGVIGFLCGTNDGTGIMGTTVGNWTSTLELGCWAVYSDGCMFVKTNTCQGGDINYCNGATRTLRVAAKTSAATGSGLNICAGNACTTSSATYTGGNLIMCGGRGSNYSGAWNSGGSGGYAMICGGGGGSDDDTGTSGGHVYIRGGCGGTGPYSASGNGGNVYICGGSALSTTCYGDIFMEAGDTYSLCVNGDARITAGSTNTTLWYSGAAAKLCTTTSGVDISGTIKLNAASSYICGCNGTSPSTIRIIGGCSTDTGTSGIIYICGGCGTSTAGTGGGVYICAGAGKGASNGGTLTVRSGSGGPDLNADGGVLYLCGGSGDFTCGCGGNICIVGYRGYGATCFGSRIYIKPGAGASTTYYGCVSLFYGTSQKMYTCNGGICVVGAIGCTSDCRIKKNVVPVSNALSMVDCLCGVCFDYCDEEYGGESIGLIAQDVEPILPRVVTQGRIEDDNREELAKFGIEDGMYGLNYGGFVPVLLEAVKEEHVCIKELQTQLGEQCDCVLCLQQQIDELKNLINNG